jgi:hypothetical protein
MTKQDYQKLARVIADLRRQDSWYVDLRHEPGGQADMAVVAVAQIENRLADMLARERPEFNRARFFKACARG